jgi:hypothetical protein
MMYEKDYFDNLVNLIKYTDIESVEESIQKSKNVCSVIKLRALSIL